MSRIHEVLNTSELSSSAYCRPAYYLSRTYMSVRCHRYDFHALISEMVVGAFSFRWRSRCPVSLFGLWFTNDRKSNPDQLETQVRTPEITRGVERQVPKKRTDFQARR